MFSAVTSCANGHTQKKKSGTKKHNAARLTGKPNRPNVHRRMGEGSPKRRRHTRHPIVMKCENRSATHARELMVLSALSDSMLIRANRQVTAREAQMARRGIFQPGVTCASQFENGMPMHRVAGSAYGLQSEGRSDHTAVSLP